jgi:hypothetical protein
MSAIEWPKGARPASFLRQARAHTQAVLAGTLLAIDPASGKASMPGYALFQNGQMRERGTIEIDSNLPVQQRLSELYECVRAEFGTGIDLLVVERLRGNMVHPSLHWSTGVVVAACGGPPVLEVPIECWKSLAKVKPGYTKADDQDAELIGETVILAVVNPDLGPAKRAAKRRRRGR